MTEDLTALSASQLDERDAVTARERQRRAQLGQAQRAEQFAAELAQVRGGERRVDPEHLAYLTPGEVAAAIDRGQLVHQGIGPDRRKSRR
jgi:hypothetical protein